MAANSTSGILTPFGYSWSTSTARTRSPVSVVVVQMWFRIVS